MSATGGPLGPGTGSFTSAVSFDPDHPVVTTVASHLATTVFVVGLEAGQELSEHPAPAELTLLVIEGQPTITVAGESEVRAVGDVIVMAAGTAHSLSARAQRAVVVGVFRNGK